MKRGPQPNTYTLHNNNNLLATGTIKAIAKELSITEQYIRKISSKTYVGPYELIKCDKPIKKRRYEYALYKGDDYIVGGTIKKIAEFQGVTVNCLWKIRTKSYQGQYELIKLEE